MLTIDTIQYAPASALVAEVEALRQANAPESVVGVLMQILEERKEQLEKAVLLTEKALMRVFQANFKSSLIDNYKYYKKELEAILTLNNTQPQK